MSLFLVAILVPIFCLILNFNLITYVEFLAASAIPSGCIAISVQGFVDVMVVNDDPEYQVKLDCLKSHFCVID